MTVHRCRRKSGKESREGGDAGMVRKMDRFVRVELGRTEKKQLIMFQNPR